MRNLQLRIRHAVQEIGLACVIAPLAAVIVRWGAVTPGDLKGYRIYYGNAPGQYTAMLEVGKVTSCRLDNLLENTPYYFAVTSVDTAGNESQPSAEVYALIPPGPPPDPGPAGLKSYNFPNPFRAGRQTTQIRYFLSAASTVRIEIFDAGNNRLRTLLPSAFKAAGEHVDDVWDGTDDHGRVVANGVYFCKIATDAYTHVVKIAVSN